MKEANGPRESCLRASKISRLDTECLLADKGCVTAALLSVLCSGLSIESVRDWTIVNGPSGLYS